MANPLRGEVALEADGKTYTLRLSVNEIVEIETELGMVLGEIIESVRNEATLRLGTVRAMLWGALREHHPEMSLRDAGDLVAKVGLGVAIAKISETFEAGFPAPEPGRSNPPRRARSGTGARS